MFWKEEVPKYRNKDAAGNEIKIEIIAGNLFGIKAPLAPQASWAADSKNEVGVWNIHLKPNAQLTLPKASSGINRILYFYIGNHISIAGKAVKKYHSIEVQTDVDLEIKNNNHESRILVLKGKPINQPVIPYGSFLMNTKEEIQ